MLISAKLTAAGYDELSRGMLVGGSFMTPAVVSGGRPYARSAKKVYCVDVAN